MDIKVSQLLNDLSSGLTWLKRDDLGYGSIQEKYQANENQISIIRKHPLLKDADTTATIINIIDDTKDSPVAISGKANSTTNDLGKTTDNNLGREDIQLASITEEVAADAGEAFNKI